MCFNREGVISTLNDGPLKLLDKFTYLGSSVSSTESNANIPPANEWIAINWQSIIRKFDLSDEIKGDFFQAAVVSILLDGCTTWTLTKRIEKKLDVNCTKMLRAIMNKSWKQHHTKQQLYSNLPPISKIIQVRQTRHSRHCWKSKDVLMSGILEWNPAHRCGSVGMLVDQQELTYNRSARIQDAV